MKRFVIFIGCLLSLHSCTGYRALKTTSNDACLDDYKKQTKSTLKNFLYKTKDGTTKSTSYIATGLGYTADVALIATKGVIVGLVLCSPVIALDVAVGNRGSGTSACLSTSSVIFSGNSEYPLGNSTHNATKSWRCPSIDHIVKAARKSISCLADKGKKEEAKLQLSTLKSDSLIEKCASQSEKEKLAVMSLM